jgi:hypothetical protein
MAASPSDFAGDGESKIRVAMVIFELKLSLYI